MALVALMDMLRDRRSTIDPTLDTSALEGKRLHETLYGNYARSAHNWRRVTFLCLLVILYDRYELGWVVNEKRYVPVPIHTHDDGSVTFLGTLDPAWKPDDRMILDEVQWLIQTIRGRTMDARFDKKLWQRAYNHSTLTGQTQLGDAYAELEKVPEKGRIEIEFVSRNKLSDQTFDVRWDEKRHDIEGNVKKVLRFRGLFQEVIDVPMQDYAALRLNVKGVWHDGWSIDPEGQ